MDRPRRKHMSILLLFLILSSAQATSLIQALQNVGASQFAAELQADPAALAIYLSNRVQTVFAPIDGPTTNTSASKLQRRQSNPIALQRLLYHSTANTNTLGSMSSGSGLAMKSNDISPKLGGKSQVFVSTPLNQPKPKPNICAGDAAKAHVEVTHWQTVFVPTFVYITMSATVSIEVPMTEYITLSITIDSIHFTTVVTTVRETYVNTVHNTDFITVHTTDVTTLPITDFITVPTTDFITLATTEVTTLYSTDVFTEIQTELSTVPITILTTILTTSATTVLNTLLSTIHTTISKDVPTTILSTVSTEVPTTILSTVSTEVLTTILSTLSTEVPTTILSTVSTELRKTILSTVSTEVPTTILSTVSTEIPTTILSTLPTTATTKVPTTVSTVVSTRLLPTSTPSLVKISTGLGNAVNIIRADILYDGGVIQVVDDYFTLPESLSNTANANGQTAFTGLAKSHNLTDTLDNTPYITYFIPSNSAFATENSTDNYPSIENLLMGHLIPNFAGYLPSLTHGTTLRSKSGSEFTVKVQGSDYYLNNAKIILANVIVENGVAHVIDQIIEPSFAPNQRPRPNSGSSFQYGSLQVVVLGLALFLIVALSG